MNLLTRRLALTSLCLVALAASGAPLEPAAPAAVGLSAERLERLTAALEAYVDEGQLAGSVTLVARRGRVAYLEAVGFRDREARDLMREDSMFRIASQTKAIVSVGAMLLVEEGKLLLTDPVSKYLPEFASTTVAIPKDGGGYSIEPAARPITVRHLFTHTSGIGYGTGPAAELWREAGFSNWYFAHRSEPIRASIERIAALPAAAHPGERWIYGYNTDILGAVIEVASGQPLDRFLRERIFEPLGMSDTHFYLPREKRDRLATVYAMQDGRLVRAPEGEPGQGEYVDGPRTSFSGGAGLVSTAQDYARFLQMLLDGGTVDGRRILSRKTVELMTVDHLDGIDYNAGQGFGLGFFVVEDVGARGWPGSVGEFGWGGAYHTTYWVDPAEELVVVHLTQLLPAGNVDDQAKVRALVYQAIDD